MDGLTFARALRAGGRYQALPISGMTAKSAAPHPGRRLPTG